MQRCSPFAHGLMGRLRKQMGGGEAEKGDQESVAIVQAGVCVAGGGLLEILMGGDL